MSSDLLVIGLDTCTDREVFIEDADVDVWRRKSYRRGDSSLICAHCFAGYDAPEGTVVPLVVKYREGGFRRAHFAHRPGMAPPGGHAPETLWHSEAKHSLARWAATLPNVISAIPERTTANRARRADVLIWLDDSTRMALEVQHRLEHDDDWRERHDSYRTYGVVDVWLWHPSLTRTLPMITAAAGLPIWFLELVDRRIGSVWGQPHPRDPGWFTEQDLSVYSPHQPPCPYDLIAYKTLPWNKFGLDRNGLYEQDWSQAHQTAIAAIRVEADFSRRKHERREAEKTARREQLAQLRAEEAANSATCIQQPPAQSTTASSLTQPEPAQSPKPPPWEIPKGIKPPICDLCPYPLAPMWWESGRHGDCEEQRMILNERASASRRRSKRPSSTAPPLESNETSATVPQAEYQQPELPFD